MTMMLWVKRIIARIEAATSGYLVQVGWIETRARRLACDNQGLPIPWFTYPAVRLLQDRVAREWRVLEFGAGAGTQWWARQGTPITAVEHDATWASLVTEKCAARVFIAGAGSAAEYMREALASGPFEVVIVDGLYREECLAKAPTLLAPSGFIVLDDAQRPEYRAGVEDLRTRGFRVLELHGPQPVSKHPGCTAIIYREGNALGL